MPASHPAPVKCAGRTSGSYRGGSEPGERAESHLNSLANVAEQEEFSALAESAMVRNSSSEAATLC